MRNELPEVEIAPVSVPEVVTGELVTVKKEGKERPTEVTEAEEVLQVGQASVLEE